MAQRRPSRTSSEMGDRPTYLEAYPRLDSRAVSRALCEGRTTWGWRVDTRWVGHARVERSRPDLVSIHYAVHGLPHLRRSPFKANVGVSKESSPQYKDYILFLCPICRRRCRKIVHVDRWTCFKCSDLYHVSELLKVQGRLVERLRHLDQVISKGKPKRQRSATFLSLLEERKSVRASLKRQPHIVSEHLKWRVTACPIAEDDECWRDPGEWDWEDYDELEFPS
jgi:hypothetical protein